jgi:hypothetical protein
MPDLFQGFRLLQDKAGRASRGRKNWQECAVNVGRKGGSIADTMKECHPPRVCHKIKRGKSKRRR